MSNSHLETSSEGDLYYSENNYPRVVEDVDSLTAMKNPGNPGKL